jgi:hypothetical protein
VCSSDLGALASPVASSPSPGTDENGDSVESDGTGGISGISGIDRPDETSALQILPPACANGIIGEIVVNNNSVFNLSDPNRRTRFDWVYRLANDLHARTEAEVIRREVLFEVGDCYDPNALRDSERMLRAMSFISDANIYSTREPDGTMQIRIDTRDEWSTQIKPTVRASGTALTGLWLSEDNLFGTGNHLGAWFNQGRVTTEFGATYYHPQAFRSRWDLTLAGAQTDVGYNLHQSLFFPFVGEAGRFAIRQTIDRQDEYFELLMPWQGEELARVWVPVSQELFEVSGAWRWGSERYNHTVLGAGLAGERIRYPEDAIRVGEPREVADVALPVTWYPATSVRLMLMAGQRNVRYIRRRAVDTVNGFEDVRLGAEAQLTLGPTISVLSRDRDMTVEVRLGSGGEPSATTLIGGNFLFEGRRTYTVTEGLPEWQDVLAAGNLWAYAKPSVESRHLLVGSISALGGWHSRGPFQLSLGGVAGLRGFPQQTNPGGRRVVGSLEYRTYLGWPYREIFDTGTVLFVDAGRIWQGHAPFGEPAFRASAGFGLRAAFPPGSRQTFRLDVGFPLEHNTKFSAATITIGMGQAIGRTASRNDTQLNRSARYRLELSDFEARGMAP